jgi:hypothetical protein
LLERFPAELTFTVRMMFKILFLQPCTSQQSAARSWRRMPNACTACCLQETVVQCLQAATNASETHQAVHLSAWLNILAQHAT